MTPPIVVHPPNPHGGRRVTAHATVLGVAHSRTDVISFLRKAGLHDVEARPGDIFLIDWRRPRRMDAGSLNSR